MWECLDFRDTVTDFDMPAGTFSDVAVVHLITTATMDSLRALYPPGRSEVRRFRPNIVVSTGRRRGELVAIRWPDIRWQEADLLVASGRSRGFLIRWRLCARRSRACMLRDRGVVTPPTRASRPPMPLHQ
jgi:integrase